MKLISLSLGFSLVVLVGGCTCRGASEAPRRSSTKSVAREHSAVYLAASQIIVSYQGAANAPSTVKRTKPQAEQLAHQLVEQLRANPAAFAGLARAHSDAPTASLGGILGAWKRGQMPAPLERAVERLEVGRVSGAIETPAGFQILLRHISQLAAAQILISYRGASPRLPHVVRTRPEALALAQDLARRLQLAPQDFAIVAGKHSDDVASRRQAGWMGRWSRASKPAVIEDALDRMQINEVSQPIDTPAGFVILRRLQP